jgi:exoribonuclease-2
MGLSVEPGRVVLFDHDGGLEIGVVVDSAGFKFNVTTSKGEEMQLALGRLQPLEAFLDRKLFSNFKSELNRIWDSASQLTSAINVHNIHTVVASSPEVMPVEKLAEIAFKAAPTPIQIIASKIALCADKLYFKRHNAGFEPRTAAAIQELVNAKLEKEKRAANLLAFANRLKEFSGRRNLSPEDTRLLECLEQAAAGAEDLPVSQEELKELFDRCEEALLLESKNATSQNRAWKILTAIRHFNERTDLAPYRHRIPGEFSGATLEAATEVVNHSPDTAGRQLVKAECFTIDDESTLDIDDAVSLEQTIDGYILGVHISDVACAIPGGSVLDKEASHRATSVYLAQRTVNMLPDILSEEHFSLVKGKARNCLSCFFEISSDFQVKGYKFSKTVVTVSRRLSYREVDAALEGDSSTLSALYQIASENLTKRIEAGALNMSKEDAYVKVNADGSLTLQVADEEAPSRLLVSEMMVMYNVAVAEFCSKAAAAILYRGQEAPKGPPLKNIPEGPALDYAMRARMRRSFTSSTPVRHAGLAVDFYTQATSPIRRFADIVTQRQLITVIDGQVPSYSTEDLNKLSESLGQPLARANAASKESRRFWMLRYLLESGCQGCIYDGTVVKIEERYILVELAKIYLTVLVKPTSNNPKLGALVKVKVLGIDPQADQIRCALT